MGGTVPAPNTIPTSKVGPSITKLPRLPKTHRIQKRPLLHPPIASPYASAVSAQKVIYVATRTSFVGVLARVKKLLARGEARRAQSVLAQAKAGERGPGNGKGRVPASSEDGEQQRKEEVVLKATGRAIERGLALALALQQDGGFCVLLKTGSVGTVDDVVKVGKVTNDAQEDMDWHATEEDMEVENELNNKASPSAEVAETRIRFVSVLEVRVSLPG